MGKDLLLSKPTAFIGLKAKLSVDVAAVVLENFATETGVMQEIFFTDLRRGRVVKHRFRSRA